MITGQCVKGGFECANGKNEKGNIGWKGWNTLKGWVLRIQNRYRCGGIGVLYGQIKGILKPDNAVFTTMVSPTGGIRCGTAIEQNV